MPRYTVSPSSDIPVVPSTSVPLPIARWSGTQAAGRPRAQSAQWPQDGAHESTTSSPTRTESTSSPTCSTMPAPSWPSTIGVGRCHSPLTWCRSVPQMPTAAMRTTTSFGPGSARSSSTTSSGSPTARKSPARVFMRLYAPIAAFTAAQLVTWETFWSA